MLTTATVYKYQHSGRHIVYASNGFELDLNRDFSLSSKKPHNVKAGTRLYKTPYRMELETTKLKEGYSYRIIRVWNNDRIKSNIGGSDSPLEERIDISPSTEFNSSELTYVGKSDGHDSASYLFMLSFFSLMGYGYWKLWGLILIPIGILIIYLTKTEGNPARISEVKQAKERLTKLADEFLSKEMKDIKYWSKLNGIQFERALARLYKNDGYEVNFTPRTNDKGVDLILLKDGRTTIVQCKAYGKNVGVAAVRELQGVKAGWGDADAILATVFDFTKATKEFAAIHNIKLFSVSKDYLNTSYRF